MSEFEGFEDEAAPEVPVPPEPPATAHVREDVEEPDPAIPQVPDEQEPSPNPQGTPEPQSRDAHLEGKVAKRGPKQVEGPNDPISDARFDEITQSLPVSTVEDDPSAPDFILVRDAFGKGMHSIRLVDGTPVGVWLKEQHPDLTGAQVEDLLARMGLEEVWPGRSEWFGKHRDKARAATSELASMPAVKEFAKAEQQHTEQTASMRAAFIEARKKDKK